MADRRTSQSGVRSYARQKLALTAYRRGFREHQILWRGLWYGILIMRAIRWLRPASELVAREVLKPGETVTIFQTTEQVGKRRR